MTTQNVQADFDVEAKINFALRLYEAANKAPEDRTLEEQAMLADVQVKTVTFSRHSNGYYVCSEPDNQAGVYVRVTDYNNLLTCTKEAGNVWLECTNALDRDRTELRSQNKSLLARVAELEKERLHQNCRWCCEGIEHDCLIDEEILLDGEKPDTKTAKLREARDQRNDRIIERDDALAALTLATERVSALENWLGNILAVVHRDGGQYQELHGTETAVLKALTVIPEAFQIVDGLTERAEKAEAENKALDARNDKLAEECTVILRRLRATEESESQLMDERDRAQDALQETHIALGGDGEWVGRTYHVDPPESGDLHLDVPVLAAQIFSQLSLARTNALGEARWQLIETAPKDGTEILAVNGTRVRIVEWDKEDPDYKHKCWRIVESNTNDFGIYSDLYEPTHWMPLPALESAAEVPVRTFQERVAPWMQECFGAEISADKTERNHRFLEEALELVQACGCTQLEAQQLVDYVFKRATGEPSQEVGGVMVTLAALCLANEMDMHSAGETELARIWTKIEQIRAKQAAKPRNSPLPAREVGE